MEEAQGANCYLGSGAKPLHRVGKRFKGGKRHGGVGNSGEVEGFLPAVQSVRDFFSGSSNG